MRIGNAEGGKPKALGRYKQTPTHVPHSHHHDERDPSAAPLTTMHTRPLGRCIQVCADPDIEVPVSLFQGSAAWGVPIPIVQTPTR